MAPPGIGVMQHNQGTIRRPDDLEWGIRLYMEQAIQIAPGQGRRRLFEARAGGRAANGLLPHAIHDARHFRFVAGPFIRGPEFGIRRNANGRKHFVHKLAQAWVGATLHATGYAG